MHDLSKKPSMGKACLMLCHVLCNAALAVLASSQPKSSQQVIHTQNVAAVVFMTMHKRSSKSIQSLVKYASLQHFRL